MSNRIKINDNIFKLGRQRDRLEEELKRIEAMPERNANQFRCSKRLVEIQRVKRKLNLNSTIIGRQLELLKGMKI